MFCVRIVRFFDQFTFRLDFRYLGVLGMLFLELVQLDEDFYLKHEFVQERQVYHLLIFGYVLVKHAVPDRILHQVEILDLAHVLFTVLILLLQLTIKCPE